MDIKVGSVQPVQSAESSKRNDPQVIEAQVLAVRLPRRSKGRRNDQEERRQRHAGARTDPANGRVLVLMVPDSNLLPSDFDTKNYRVFLRFARPSA